MKKIQELDALYQNQLKLKLKSLERTRKKILMINLASIVFFTLSLIALISIFIAPESSTDGLEMFILLLFPFIGIITLFSAGLTKKKYRDSYKSDVVSEIVKQLNPDWHYSPDMNIWIKDYLQSDLFKTLYSGYTGDDLIWGKIDKTDFQCSELHTYNSASTNLNPKGKSGEVYHSIFKGLFFHADFNKHFKGRTYVAPDTAEKLLGKAGHEFQTFFKNAKLVKLENAEFEKEFVVHSTDQVEARYIITPAIMQAMLNIRKAYKTPIRFSFIGTRVYCALSYNGKLFEPKIWRSGVNFDDIKFMHHLFQVNETIIKELNLNTRIWTKE